MHMGFVVDSRWVPSFRRYILPPSSGPQITAIWICTCVESGLICAMCTHSPTSWQVFVLCRWGMQCVILRLFVHKTKNSRRPVFTAELLVTFFETFLRGMMKLVAAIGKAVCLISVYRSQRTWISAMGITGLVMEVRVLGTPFTGLENAWSIWFVAGNADRWWTLTAYHGLWSSHA